MRERLLWRGKSRRVRVQREQEQRRRKLIVEPLEARIVLASAADLLAPPARLAPDSDAAALLAQQPVILPTSTASAALTSGRSDLNRDGSVSPIDALLVANVMIGSSAGSMTMDVNEDGAVNAMDFDYVIGDVNVATHGTASSAVEDQVPEEAVPDYVASPTNLDVSRTPDSVADVNRDGTISPGDALIVINAQQNIGGSLDPRLDVTGDGVYSDSDVAWIIAHVTNAMLNNGGASAQTGRSQQPTENSETVYIGSSRKLLTEQPLSEQPTVPDAVFRPRDDTDFLVRPPAERLPAISDIVQADGSGVIPFDDFPESPQTIGTSFAAISLGDQFIDLGAGSIPPDTMGAVGPNHFMEVINSSVAIFDKSGTQLSHVTLTSFFTTGSHPLSGSFDPRVLYDQHSGRWFATVMERGAVSGEDNDIILAVSRTDDPTGTWDKYIIPVGIPTSGDSYFTDYSTLGVDDNGVYFGMRMFVGSGGSFAKIAATPKAPLVAASPSLGTVTQWSNITDMYSSPQPAVNFDDVGASDRAWFVAASPYVYGNLVYRTLTWSGGTPTLSSTSSTLSTPAFSAPLNAPALGSTTNINVGDMRLQMAVIRDNRLWTTRNVGVNSSGGASSADRTGVEWFELNVTTSTPSIVQTGRVYDTAASNPYFYYYPSVMVNGQGHMALGFSGSKSTEYVGAFTTGRLATDTLNTTQAVTVLKAGEYPYERLDTSGRNRWGDYSYTSLDPNDDMTMWTIQEYAEDNPCCYDIWDTWVAQLRSEPPSLNNPNGSGAQGTSGISLSLVGTDIYDPGSGFVDRLDVELTGGAINGISNYNVTYNSPTSATVMFDVAANASTGFRNVVLTNPDGQTVTVVNGFEVVTVSPTPTSVDLLAATDTGVSSTDDTTNLDNSTAGKKLQFDVTGTVSGATVTIYADAVAIGSATAGGTTTTVTTNGTQDLADGSRSITAKQTVPGNAESLASPALSVTIDTVAPTTSGPALDNGFDGDGKQTTAFYTSFEEALDMAIQTDGKSVLVGRTVNGFDEEFGVARYTTSGILDTTFDADGKLSTGIGPGNADALGVALQTDGKIVVVGRAHKNVSSTYEFAVVRYNTNGSLDTTFDSDGIVTTSIGGITDVAYDVAILSDGDILVGGTANNGTRYDFALARYNSDGSLDSSFGSGGIVTTSVDGTDGYSIGEIAIQSDGKIVAAGKANSGGTKGAILRYNANGSLDTTFDGDGKLVSNFGLSSALIESVTLQADGKIVAGGVFASDFGLVRLKTDGSLDTTFDTDGIVTTNFGSLDAANHVLLQTDGKIVIVGARGATNDEAAIVRFNYNGSLDTSFDGDGKLTVSFGGGSGDERFEAAALDSSGRLLAVGAAHNGTNRDFAIARIDMSSWPSLDLQAASDFGSSTVDNLTNDNTPTFDILAGPYFRVYRDAVQISGDSETGATYATAVQADGTYAYTVAAVDLAGNVSAQGAAVTATIETVPNKLQTLTIGSVSSSRSAVREIKVSFDGVVVPAAGAFEVNKKFAGGGAVTVGFTTAEVANKTVATLTFSGSYVDASGALLDGNYDLRVVAANVADAAGNPFDGDGNGTGGDDYTIGSVAADKIFSLYGDADGDGDVDGTDFAGHFIPAYGSVSPGGAYRIDLDFDGDGDIDGTDFAAGFIPHNGTSRDTSGYP